MEAIKTLDEIEALVRGANLDSNAEGELHPSNAMSDLRGTSGERCGEAAFGNFLGIRNTNTSRVIQAYYEIRRNINGPWQGERQIGPGQTAWIACSRPTLNQWMSLHITGARYV